METCCPLLHRPPRAELPPLCDCPAPGDTAAGHAAVQATSSRASPDERGLGPCCRFLPPRWPFPVESHSPQESGSSQERVGPEGGFLDAPTQGHACTALLGTGGQFSRLSEQWEPPTFNSGKSGCIVHRKRKTQNQRSACFFLPGRDEIPTHQKKENKVCWSEF